MFSTWDSKNPILFGCGTSRLTGEKLKQFGCKKVLAVFDRGVQAAGLVEPILDNIKAAGIDFVCYDGVLPDPPDYIVGEAAALGVAERVDGIVGIGGGSPMDTAKGVRVLLTNSPPVNKYFVSMDTPALDETKMKPLVVIPTTAGTGSEASPGAIITDSRTRQKRAVNCSVTLGIVDPELTVGMPPEITASTGIDALSHALEALTSRMPNRLSETVGKEAVSLIGRYLPLACREGSNLEAREAMSLAATLSTVCLRGPYGHIPHAFGKGLSRNWPVSHGTSVGVLLAETMRFVAPAVPGQVKLIAQCMGAEAPGDASPAEIGHIAADAVRRLLHAVHFPAFNSFVKNKTELLDKISDIYVSPAMQHFTPRPMSLEEAEKFLSNSYDAL